MIAPRSAGKRSEMSASRPRAAGVAPARTNRPTAATATADDRHDERQAGDVVDDEAGHDQDAAADDRRTDDRRPAQVLEPVAPVEQAGAEDDRDGDRGDRDLVGVKPAIRTWSGNVGFALRELEERLAEPQPDATR